MSSTTLLLIEDDVSLAELLIEYLSPEGYQIIHAKDGEQGLFQAKNNSNIDLILLDVMLPKIDGFEVLRELRRSHLTPVLMLTAKGDDFDRIYGLEAGADDYLPKPFNHRELSARIKAIVRRSQITQLDTASKVITVDNIDILASARTVTCNGSEIELTGTEFSILYLLMTNVGELVSKDNISEQVLGRALAAYDRSIDMHVSNLRKKIAKHCPTEKIKTVRGIGYLMMSS